MTRLLLSILCAASLHAGLIATSFAADTPSPADVASKPSPGLSLLPSITAAPATPATTAAVKLGVVDINRISAESTLGKAAQTKIKEQQARLQKQVDAKKRQLEKLKTDIERQLPTLNPAQREAKAREFQKKVEELQKFGINAEKGLLETQERLTKELLTSIEQAAAAIGKDKGLAAVVVKREMFYLGANVEPVEISEDIVRLLNAASKK